MYRQMKQTFPEMHHFISSNNYPSSSAFLLDAHQKLLQV